MTVVTGEWLSAPGAQKVMGLLETAGFHAYAVGGCVRNALLNEPVADVDISTDAHPDTVSNLAKKAGLKVVPTGIEHGTVTVVADGVGYEITTFRADVETDGRRAVVRFSDDITEDARRRDFTMNALYADRNGVVLDPLGGLPDLAARRLRFIEDAERRIKEDYLRILRFFRFFAWYGDPAEGMDAEALAAIASNLDGLATLSRERVGTELVKLLTAPDPVMAVATMEQTGVLSAVLPGAISKPLGPLTFNEEAMTLSPNGLRRLAVLGFFDGSTLRLSKVKQRQLAQYQSLMSSSEGPNEMAYKYGVEVALDAIALRAASLEQPVSLPDLETLQAASKQRFPIKAQDLMTDFSGAVLGQKLKQLEERWVASDFTLDKDALLAKRNEG